MPKRTDIKSILILDAGLIVIDQVCKFGCPDAQACKTLREGNYRVILVSPNPVTIMTDSEMADAIYIKSAHWEVVHRVIERERLDAVPPTMGDQMVLNYALELERQDALAGFGVIMIGVTADAIDKAEDRCRFDIAIKKIGFDTARLDIAHTMEEAPAIAADVGFPCIIRSSFTIGSTGDGIAYNREEFEEIRECGLDLSPTNELLIDEPLIGWKEYKMEVVCDKNDDCIIVCSIENFDAMGIHASDSITVAPTQMLTDKKYQVIHNTSMVVLREIGVEIGDSNVQFAVNPKNNRLVVIETNPRMPRSSALAPKAIDFPIAKIAAKLAVGYALDELMDDIIDGRAPAPFEPLVDHAVTKMSRFNFEESVGANDHLTTQMKSVGEVMAIGRTQQESLQRVLRGPEAGVTGFDPKVSLDDPEALTKIRHELKDANAERIWYIAGAFRTGLSVSDVFSLTSIGRWFLVRTEELVRLGEKVTDLGINGLDVDFPRVLKHKGFADARLAKLAGVREVETRKLCDQYNLYLVYEHVDACTTGFVTDTTYMYPICEDECEVSPSVDHNKIMMLGSGPNHIGQGIEFDCYCVHTLLALRKDGYETVMVSCNPETVSTDYDTSDRLYFESVTLEDVLEIVRIERPRGVTVQHGGQTPLKLARALEVADVPVIGTSPDTIDRAENRKRFQQMADRLELKQPVNTTVTAIEQAVEKAKGISYPLVVRPPYVLGGRVMETVYDEADLCRYLQATVSVSNDTPVLLSHFLDDVVGMDVGAVCGDKIVSIGGIMEHIEQTGVCSGDSACSLPAYTLSQEIWDVMRQQVQKLAFELQVRSLMNVRFAVKNSEVYLIEMNSRAAHTVPFVSKATGVLLMKVAAHMAAGKTSVQQDVAEEVIPPYYSIKEVVLSLNKFPGVDLLSRPEMRPAGEVMGMSRAFTEVFTRARLDSSSTVKKQGRILFFVCEGDRECVVDLAMKLLRLGFELNVVHGTTIALDEAGINPRLVNKVHGDRLYIQGRIKNGGYTYIINTAEDRQAIEDFKLVYCSALRYKAHYDTTLSGSFTTVMALNADATEKVILVWGMHTQIRKQ